MCDISANLRPAAADKAFHIVSQAGLTADAASVAVQMLQEHVDVIDRADVRAAFFTVEACVNKMARALSDAAESLDPESREGEAVKSGGNRGLDKDVPDHLAALGREATYEIAALAQAIVEHFGQLTGEDQRPLVVRGMALRIHELNGHVMSILDVPEEFASGPNGRHLRRRILGEAQ